MMGTNISIDDLLAFFDGMGVPVEIKTLKDFDAIDDDLPFSEPPRSPDEEDDSCNYLEDDHDVFCIPGIRSVIFSGPATTILWVDDTKTTVRVADGQEYDRYAGFCAAVCKKLFGTSAMAKQMMDIHDAALIRAAKEEKKEQNRRKSFEEQQRALRKKAENVVPSYSEFHRMASELAVQKVIEKMADNIANSFFRTTDGGDGKEE